MASQSTIVTAMFGVALTAGGLLVGCKSTGQKAGAPAAIDLYVAGVRAYQAGDEKLAISNLVTATETNDNLIMASTLLGDLYKAQGQYDKARDAYQRVAKLDSYNYVSHYNLGVTYQLLDQLKEAVASYKRALVLEPNHLESNMNLGLAYVALRDNDDAIKSLRKATELDPKSAPAWANLGVALDGKEQYADAERAYRTSLDLKSDQRSTLLNLGANLVRQKKTSEAVSVLEQAVAKGDEPFASKQYGDALALAGRFDEALVQYDKALAKNPRFIAALNEKGNTLIAQYKKGLELDDVKRAAAIDAWKKSLEINGEQGRVKESIKRWEKGSL